MKIIHIEEQSAQFNNAIALGNFDGVHIGHQELINLVKIKAKEFNLKASMLVFENHTKSMVYGNGPKLINNSDQKNKILSDLGIEVLYTMRFDEMIMTLAPEKFVKKILIDQLKCKVIVVGPDYRFGYKASGDVKLLKRLCVENNIDLVIADSVYFKGEVVSSTIIRKLIAEGNIIEANMLLGRDYSILGEVVNGKGLGKKLGVPTANIIPKGDYILPKNGIYRTYTKANEVFYDSATNIGYNPTFDELNLKIENHIIDYDDDIYGETIEIFFKEFIRPEYKFDRIEDLVIRMKEDISYVKLNSDLQKQ